MSAQLAADEAGPPLSQSDKMDMRFQATMTNPEDQKVRLEMTVTDSADSTMAQTKPAH
jgi:hypothetical protein